MERRQAGHMAFPDRPQKHYRLRDWCLCFSSSLLGALTVTRGHGTPLVDRTSGTHGAQRTDLVLRRQSIAAVTTDGDQQGIHGFLQRSGPYASQGMAKLPILGH